MGDVGGRLNGKHALITGAASGIGRAVALQFAREGATLHLVDRDRAHLDEVADQTRGTGRSAASVVDLAEPAQLSELAARTQTVDVLVNCAADLGSAMRVIATETSIAAWQRAWQVNVTAPLVLSQAVLPGMMNRRAGVIVNVTTVGATRGFVKYCPYVVTKGALLALTRSLALDYGTYGIRVNAVSPGAIDTPGASDLHTDRAAYLEMISGRCALERIGTPEEAAACVTFLASDAASYVTGSELVVDGARY
jgi:3-oxoacyl-[acyl-carrier protein] reductase